MDGAERFRWSGSACDQLYSANGNGEIDLGDLSADLDGDGDIAEDDLQIYLDMSCTFQDSVWIFDSADLVVSGWDYKNNGAKLVQTRFYPVDTTTFE